MRAVTFTTPMLAVSALLLSACSGGSGSGAGESAMTGGALLFQNPENTTVLDSADDSSSEDAGALPRWGPGEDFELRSGVRVTMSATEVDALESLVDMGHHGMDLNPFEIPVAVEVTVTAAQSHDDPWGDLLTVEFVWGSAFIYTPFDNDCGSYDGQWGTEALSSEDQRTHTSVVCVMVHVDDAAGGVWRLSGQGNPVEYHFVEMD